MLSCLVLEYFSFFFFLYNIKYYIFFLFKYILKKKRDVFLYWCCCRLSFLNCAVLCRWYIHTLGHIPDHVPIPWHCMYRVFIYGYMSCIASHMYIYTHAECLNEQIPLLFIPFQHIIYTHNQQCSTSMPNLTHAYHTSQPASIHSRIRETPPDDYHQAMRHWINLLLACWPSHHLRFPWRELAITNQLNEHQNKQTFLHDYFGYAK